MAAAAGEGSCFTVMFPVAQGVAAIRQAAGAYAAKDGTGTILVVDDDEIVRDMAKRAIARNGFEVLVANNGPEAIDILKRHPGDISLVVLDQSMPGLNGDDVLPQLRQVRPGVRVVISSGYDEIATMALFQGQRVSGFIQKPYTSGRLAEKIKAALA